MHILEHIEIELLRSKTDEEKDFWFETYHQISFFLSKLERKRRKKKCQ